jgi:4-azaleucine resistance transporter AzlC
VTDGSARSSFRAGFRAGVPFGLAGFLVSLSFGVLAREVGMSAVQAIAMSAIVFAGSAQFAALSIVASGGGLGAAVMAAALMNSRFLPMGIALGPSLPGGPVSRALQGQPVVDSSWALALGEGGRFDRHFLFGHSAAQYAGWLTGTLAGALLGDVADPRALGLDAVFPAFFVAIILAELRDRAGATAAALGAAIALALLSFTPPGVPVLAASLAAIIGLDRRAARA